MDHPAISTSHTLGDALSLSKDNLCETTLLPCRGRDLREVLLEDLKRSIDYCVLAALADRPLFREEDLK